MFTTPLRRPYDLNQRGRRGGLNAFCESTPSRNHRGAWYCRRTKLYGTNLSQRRWTQIRFRQTLIGEGVTLASVTHVNEIVPKELQDLSRTRLQVPF